ncbi:hypothetical protein Tco_0673516 [Tanacetum coccineum]
MIMWIENVKDEEGKNIGDQQVYEGDDDTNNDDIGYMRQPIEDESWFLAHEIDYPNVNEKKADHRNNKYTQENRVLKGRDVFDEKSREVSSGSPIPIGDGDGDVNRFPDGDGDGDGDEAEKRRWGW